MTTVDVMLLVDPFQWSYLLTSNLVPEVSHGLHLMGSNIKPRSRSTWNYSNSLNLVLKEITMSFNYLKSN